MSFLSSLGWSSFFEEEWQKINEEGTLPARVIEEQKGYYRVSIESGDLWAELSGKWHHGPKNSGALPAVGDWVKIKPRPSEGRATVVSVLPRQSKFSRKVAGEVAKEQVVACNMDFAFLVTSLNEELNLRRIERYLTLIGESGATPVVLLTKADLCVDVPREITLVEGIAPNVKVRALSSKTNEGLKIFEETLTQGKTGVLLGSSGVGKSTLINWLVGKALQATGEIRKEDGKGRHTTTARRLIRLPSGGMLIDTPGMRELQVWEGEDGLTNAFEDIHDLSAKCRFTDCKHSSEPSCAIQDALKNGTLDRDRFKNYLKLLREVELQAQKSDKAAKSAEKIKNKKISSAMYRHLKNKR